LRDEDTELLQLLQIEQLGRNRAEREQQQMTDVDTHY
jgi:hypothetical protein